MLLIRFALATGLLLCPLPAVAESAAFDLATYDGKMLSAETLQALTAAAAQKSPPKNGE